MTPKPHDFMVTLRRPSPQVPWGIRLVGGTDLNAPLIITRPNPSYQFGFDVKDDEFTNYQNRKEQRDGNVIKGSYSVVDSDGFIRTVTYTADPKEGFKAEVSRQPTDIVVKIPTPAPQHSERFASQPQPAGPYRAQQQSQQQGPQQRPQRPQEYSQYQ